MRMTGLEKTMVNRPEKGAANVRRIAAQLDRLAGWRGTDALELGCGIGDVAAFLAAERGLRVIGADMDAAQIALARARHRERPGLAFVVADAARLEFPAASFDLVVSQNVFHHIPQWRAAVREIGRVLRPGGHLLWLDLTPPAWLTLLLRPLRAQFGLYTLEEIRAACREEGLVEVAERQLVALRHELTWRKGRNGVTAPTGGSHYRV